MRNLKPKELPEALQRKPESYDYIAREIREYHHEQHKKVLKRVALPLFTIILAIGGALLWNVLK
tara:strand:+ start:1815 stop:2006 length:192 start_codon:yes stop_codon:yes gene_type:complete